MRKTSDLLGQKLSCQASKAATDAIWKRENGIGAYSLGGKIFVGCGIGWLLLSCIPFACKTPIKEWLWMVILAAIQIVPGAIILILSKKSERFQKWAEQNLKKSLGRKKKLEEKAKIGKLTLPMTNGDILAFKIFGILAIVLVVILGIGYLQGWVV